MKKFFLIALIIALTIPTMGQQNTFRIKSVSYMVGKTTLLNRSTFSMELGNEKSTWLIDLNVELAEAIYFHKVNNWFSIGESQGFYKNVLWWGPIASLHFDKIGLSTLNWIGWSAGNPETGITEWNPAFLFNYHEVNWRIRTVQLNYTYSKYQRLDANNFVGAKKFFKVTKNLTAFAAGLYNLNKGEYLWSAGLSFALKKK